MPRLLPVSAPNLPAAASKRHGRLVLLYIIQKRPRALWDGESASIAGRRHTKDAAGLHPPVDGK